MAETRLFDIGFVTLRAKGNEFSMVGEAAIGGPIITV